MDEIIGNKESNDCINEEENEYKRDSFDVRVCDDLSEVLLSYLSFEDKIRFECISKQFKTFIFNKQKKLRNDKLWETNNRFIELSFYTKDISHKFNAKAFESVLIKCKSIDDILMCDIIAYDDKRETNNQIIDIITKNVIELKAIDFECSDFDIEFIESFGHKLGPNLVNIALDIEMSSEIKQTLIKLSPNLVCIKFIDLNDFMIGNEFIVLNKLSKVDFLDINETNEHLFKHFANIYGNQLKSLIIDSTEWKSFKTTNFGLISSFENLVEFKLEEHKVEVNDKLLDGLTRMALNCKQLNKLKLSLFCSESDCVQKLWKALNCFKQLTHLELVLDFNSNQSLKCQSLNELKNIKYFNIHSNNQSFELSFHEIEKCFPSLEELIFCGRKEVNNNALKHLAELKNLKKINFSGETKFTSEGVLDLINSDNKLSYIHISSEFEITDQLIDGFKALTVRKPKIVFELYFKRINASIESKLADIRGIRCIKSSFDCINFEDMFSADFHRIAYNMSRLPNYL